MLAWEKEFWIRKTAVDPKASMAVCFCGKIFRGSRFGVWRLWFWRKGCGVRAEGQK